MHTSNSCSCGHTLSGQVLGNNPVQFSYSTHNVGAVHNNEYDNIYHFIPFICFVSVCMTQDGLGSCIGEIAQEFSYKVEGTISISGYRDFSFSVF